MNSYKNKNHNNNINNNNSYNNTTSKYWGCDIIVISLVHNNSYCNFKSNHKWVVKRHMNSIHKEGALTNTLLQPCCVLFNRDSSTSNRLSSKTGITSSKWIRCFRYISTIWSQINTLNSMQWHKASMTWSSNIYNLFKIL